MSTEYDIAISKLLTFIFDSEKHQHIMQPQKASELLYKLKKSVYNIAENTLESNDGLQ